MPGQSKVAVYDHILQSSKFQRPMSALGQKRTLNCPQPMSALPPKADIAERRWIVRFVPKADMRATSAQR
jgi:hypothetical protein